MLDWFCSSLDQSVLSAQKIIKCLNSKGSNVLVSDPIVLLKIDIYDSTSVMSQSWKTFSILKKQFQLKWASFTSSFLCWLQCTDINTKSLDTWMCDRWLKTWENSCTLFPFGCSIYLFAASMYWSRTLHVNLLTELPLVLSVSTVFTQSSGMSLF